MIIFYFFVVLIETRNIMKPNKSVNFNIFIFCIFFLILILILIKSLLIVKGFAWQFYLLMALFNFSFIIIKLNIIYDLPIENDNYCENKELEQVL